MGPRVLYPTPRTAARVRLFCLPHSGAGASVFRPWSAQIDERIEIAAVQLPGREELIGEPPYASLGCLLNDLCAALAGHIDRPYAMFGHSMGARLAFLVTHELHARGARLPERWFFSACPAPSAAPADVSWKLADSELVERLRSLGGTPAAVLDDADLTELLIPVVHADLMVCAGWNEVRRRALAVPIRTFAGSDDRYATPERHLAWDRETSAGCAHSVLAGGHFFLPAALRSVLGIIGADLLAPAPAGEGR